MKIKVTEYVRKETSLDVVFPLYIVDCDSDDNVSWMNAKSFDAFGHYTLVEVTHFYSDGRTEVKFERGSDSSYQGLKGAVSNSSVSTQEQFERVRTVAGRILAGEEWSPFM